MTRILGIDVGSRVMGFGVVKVGDWRLLPGDLGAVPVGRAKDKIGARLGALEPLVTGILDRTRPAVVVVETQIVKGQGRGRQALPMCRGVIWSKVCQRYDQEIVEYFPATAKKTVAGHGRASKEELAAALRRIFGIELDAGDAADALATALTHAAISGLACGVCWRVLRKDRPHVCVS